MNCYPDSRNGGIENVTRMLSQQFYVKGINIHVRYLVNTEFEHTDDSIFLSCRSIKPHEIKQEITDAVIYNDIDVIINRCVIFATPILKQCVSGTRCRIITTYNNKPTLIPPTIKEVFGNNDISLWKKLLIAITYPVFRVRSISKLRKKHRQSYDSSDMTILLSDRYIAEYVDLMGIKSDKLTVINNPIKEDLRISDTDFSNKEKIILMVTRLDETQKCVIKALKIWKGLQLYADGWKLVIVGNGPDETKIKLYSNQHNIPHVDFIPACNPTNFYRKSSIFLMTSRNEGWPNTINEAMRMGCVPVVIASFSAIFEMIDDEKNGFVIPQTDESNEITDCISKLKNLICNDSKRYEMGVQAINKTERLSIDVISNKWTELFKS